MPAPLTVHNAEIKAAAVEIRTLTISGKQVTLAVFRQLREEPLIAEDGTLNGVPWGTVNYHPDKCAGEREHIHVVWQVAEELQRSRVNKPIRWDFFWDEQDWSSEFLQAAYCLNDHRRPDWMRRQRDDVGDWVLRFQVDGVGCENLDVLKAPTIGREHVCLTSNDLAEARAGLVAEVAQERARRDRHIIQWEALRTLPQLFIAV